MHIKLISEYENPTENNSPGLTEPQLVSELDYETQDQTFLVNIHHTFWNTEFKCYYAQPSRFRQQTCVSMLWLFLWFIN